MIIGVTGTKASGKGVIASLFSQRGYTYSSLSDRVREEAALRFEKPTTKDLQDIGNELREQFGHGVLAVRALDKLARESPRPLWVIDGIRNPAEIEVLASADKDFYLIGVDSPEKIRFNRLSARARDGDPLSFEQFTELDKRDKGSGEAKSGQQVDACISRADYLVWNEFTSVKPLYDFLSIGSKSFLPLILDKKRRPSFDEMFMRQAWEWSFRGTCLRRSVGAVIVQDSILLSQGYNGAARGTLHCEDRGGCERQRRNIPSGANLELCYAQHAEKNAIINAGRTGRSVVGAKLFATVYPCSFCTGDIIQAGISSVVYLDGYSTELSRQMLGEARVEVNRYSGVHPRSFSRFWG